jgi:signal transduction histidine kinase
MLRSRHVDTESFRETVENIALQSRRAGDIIRHLRDFTRKREPKWAPVEINPLIREVVHLSQFDARQRDITVHLDLEERMPKVIADNIQIQQVVLNLLRNGFEAMDSGEHQLVIRTTRLGTAAVEVAVCDRGVGLDPEAAGRLFHPFFTTKRDGMGLGLALSKSIIEAHRGRLWATPNPDRGTTFHFTLPIALRAVSDRHDSA